MGRSHRTRYPIPQRYFSIVFLFRNAINGCNRQKNPDVFDCCCRVLKHGAQFKRSSTLKKSGRLTFVPMILSKLAPNLFSLDIDLPMWTMQCPTLKEVLYAKIYYIFFYVGYSLMSAQTCRPLRYFLPAVIVSKLNISHNTILLIN